LRALVQAFLGRRPDCSAARQVSFTVSGYQEGRARYFKENTVQENKNDSPYYRLIAHPFVISVMRNTDSALKPLQKEFVKSLQEETKAKTPTKRSKKGESPSNNLTLTREQAYHNQVFEYTGNLTHAVERLEEIPFFLARFPNTKTFQKQGITLHKWIQYHYSNFLIAGVSVYDTTLLLTNSVFMLGLRPQACSDRTVTDNQNVRLTPVRDTIKKLDRVTKSYREPRNLYVHRNRLPTLDFLDRLESYRFIEEGFEDLGLAESPDDQIIHPVIRDELYKLERRKLIKTVRSETDIIADSIKEVFGELNPIYSAYSTSFRGAAR